MDTAFNFAGSMVSVLLDGLSFLFEHMASWAGWLAQYSAMAMVIAGSLNDFVSNTVVDLGWAVIRDFANMFFIVVLVMIAFETILGTEGHGFKHRLHEFFIAVVLVNFSKLFLGILIDAVQVLTLTFFGTFAGDGAGIFAEIFKVTELKALVSGDIKDASQRFFGALFNLLISGFVLITMLKIAARLLWRYVVILICIVLSPLAFLARAVPAAEALYERWWHLFSEQLFFGPIVGFLLWLLVATFTQDQSTFYEKINEVFSYGGGPLFGVETAYAQGAGGDSFIYILMSGALALSFAWAIIYFANTLSLGAAGAAGKIGGKAAKLGGRLLAKTARGGVKLGGAVLKGGVKGTAAVGGALGAGLVATAPGLARAAAVGAAGGLGIGRAGMAAAGGFGKGVASVMGGVGKAAGRIPGVAAAGTAYSRGAGAVAAGTARAGAAASKIKEFGANVATQSVQVAQGLKQKVSESAVVQGAAQKAQALKAAAGQAIDSGKQKAGEFKDKAVKAVVDTDVAKDIAAGVRKGAEEFRKGMTEAQTPAASAVEQGKVFTTKVGGAVAQGAKGVTEGAKKGYTAPDKVFEKVEKIATTPVNLTEEGRTAARVAQRAKKEKETRESGEFKTARQYTPTEALPVLEEFKNKTNKTPADINRAKGAALALADSGMADNDPELRNEIRNILSDTPGLRSEAAGRFKEGAKDNTAPGKWSQQEESGHVKRGVSVDKINSKIGKALENLGVDLNSMPSEIAAAIDRVLSDEKGGKEIADAIKKSRNSNELPRAIKVILEKGRGGQGAE